MLSNDQIAKILYEIAEYLAMEDDPFRPSAYEKAARGVELYGKSLRVIHNKSGLRGLERVPGIGKEIAKKIAEIVKTGKSSYLEKLRQASPVDVSALTQVEGLGPKKIKILWQKLGVTNLRGLEKVIKAHKIRELEGFGEKSEQNIARGLKMLKQQKERLPLEEVLPVAENIKEKFKQVPGIKRVEIAGSIRRRKETVGDIDILVSSDKPKKIIDFFKKLSELNKFYGGGETKASGRLKIGIDIDLRIVPEKSFGAAWQYFTGNQLHNIQLRQIAKKKGYKLNEYGLFKGEKQVAGKTEEEIYQKLGLKSPPPAIRNGEGEIEFIHRNFIQEKSVGAIIFHISKNSILYLLIHYPPRIVLGSERNKKALNQRASGHWDYVKGHIEANENELSALKREIKEEINLGEKDYQVLTGFKKRLKYNFRSEKGLHFKQVIFYLVKAKCRRVSLSHEHDHYKWLCFADAFSLATFKEAKKILCLADQFLRCHNFVKQGNGKQ